MQMTFCSIYSKITYLRNCKKGDKYLKLHKPRVDLLYIVLLIIAQWAIMLLDKIEKVVMQTKLKVKQLKLKPFVAQTL